jgi:hypothetical protein
VRVFVFCPVPVVGGGRFAEQELEFVERVRLVVVAEDGAVGSAQVAHGITLVHASESSVVVGEGTWSVHVRNPKRSSASPSSNSRR